MSCVRVRPAAGSVKRRPCLISPYHYRCGGAPTSFSHTTTSRIHTPPLPPQAGLAHVVRGVRQLPAAPLAHPPGREALAGGPARQVPPSEGSLRAPRPSAVCQGRSLPLQVCVCVCVYLVSFGWSSKGGRSLSEGGEVTCKGPARSTQPSCRLEAKKVVELMCGIGDSWASMTETWIVLRQVCGPGEWGVVDTGQDRRLLPASLLRQPLCG
jgi:hypothetical protein